MQRFIWQIVEGQSVVNCTDLTVNKCWHQSYLHGFSKDIVKLSQSIGNEPMRYNYSCVSGTCTCLRSYKRYRLVKCSSDLLVNITDENILLTLILLTMKVITMNILIIHVICRCSEHLNNMFCTGVLSVAIEHILKVLYKHHHDH